MNIVAITVDGEPADTIPEGNYELTENSYCTVNGEEDSSISLNYDSNTQTLQVIPFTTKGTKCYLDFTKKLTAGEQILAGKDIQTRNDFSNPVTNITTGVVYQTNDWEGISYYFAGAPTDNWVHFGGFYWRIVKVNGDGSVRLIYNGTSTATTGTGTMISSSQSFNNSYNRSYYVGLKYTVDQQHGQNTDSVILDTLQSWYASSGLSAIQYSQYIDTNVGFCSDRNLVSGTWSSGGSHDYAVYGRLVSNKSPSLACTSSDIIKESVGLITSDEVAFAGGVWVTVNQSYYLYNNANYWTMSPCSSDYGRARVFYVNSTGNLDNLNADNVVGVRPVINLKADTKFQGSGTSSLPFEVVS